MRPRSLPQVAGDVAAIVRGLAEWRGLLDPVIGQAVELPAVVTVRANYRMRVEDGVVLVNAASAACTVTLPPAVEMRGRIVVVKKVDAAATAVTIRGNATAETLDGAATQSTSTQWASFSIACDGQRWFVV